jgi:hypothetical protein
MKHYVDDKLTSIALEGVGPHKAQAVLVKPSFKEFIKTGNPFHDYAEAAKHYYEAKDLEKIDFDKAVKDELVYFFYSSGHVLFDVNGDPVPLPVMLDYISTDFHSRAVDIEKAHKVMKAHKWTLKISEIEHVPSYNADGYNHRYFSIVLLPDKKTFKKMYEMAVASKRGKEFFSCELGDLVKGKSYNYPDWDPLKLHKLRLSEKDLKKDDISEDEDY